MKPRRTTNHASARQPRTSMTHSARGIEVDWSDGIEAIHFCHSFSEPNVFFQRTVSANQALLKACGNKKHTIRTLLDLTGGWGRDSFTLAQHGKEVTMLEHNPFVHAVVLQSLQDASICSHTAAVSRRMTAILINSRDFLITESADRRFDCIYLDPMFPEHPSTAKPGKEIQLLQKLTGNWEIENCFELALQKACKRVVVKRPAKSPPFGEQQPDLYYREKTVRFDIYFCRNTDGIVGSQ